MYLKHFNLTQRPFSITPDPRFLYMSARHKEALAHLLFGLGDGGGFVQLTGEVGTGKTTICRCLLEQVPENVDLALVLNPKVTAIELIATICDELGVEYPPEYSIKTLTDALNEHLLEAHKRGRRTVLIIDEAQNLSADVLEQVRLLTNLETSTQKLLQIVLIGQPELRNLLASEDMRQLSQRVTARYHLEPIFREETEAYIKHRLQICGSSRNIFPRHVIGRIQKLSGGIPRLINVLCDRAMLGAYVEGKTKVDTKILKQAAREVISETRPAGNWNLVPWLLLVLAVLAAAALYVYRPFQSPDTRVAAQVAEPVAPAGGGPAMTPAAAPGATIDEPVSVPETVAEAGPESAPEQGAEQEPEQEPAQKPAPADEGMEAPATAGTDNEAATLSGLLAAADSSSDRAAWRELFALWSVKLPEDNSTDVCELAKQYGLLCLYEQGNWNTLRQLDRPVILKLLAPDGRRVPVVLQHLDDGVAELVIGSELYRLKVAQVEPLWYGDFSMLMQTPPGGKLYLRAGSQADDVKWLRKQLEAALGVKIPVTDPSLFDQPLKRQLLDFQRSRGLVADGVMGKNTIIHLNSKTSPAGIPRLSTGHT